MSFLKKAFNFAKDKLIPAAVQAASGNVGAAVGTLLKKKTSVQAAPTVGNTAQTAEKPSLVLGFETGAGIVKADFVNDQKDIQTKKETSVLLWVLGGLAALFFGSKMLSK